MPVERIQTASSANETSQDDNLQVNFHVQMMDYEWTRSNERDGLRYGADKNGSPSDTACDDIGLINKMLCWVKSDGLSYQEKKYNLREGCIFNYDVKQLTKKPVPFVDTIKLACFTKRPNMRMGLQEDAGSVMNMSRSDYETFALLCAKHISMHELLLNASGDKTWCVSMEHNFSCNKLRVRIKNASVSFAGTTYNDATQYENALRAANVGSFQQLCNSSMMNHSMLHTMEHRNKQIKDNAECVGRAINKLYSVSEHSIGSMMQSAYTCGMIQGELKNLSDMGKFFKSDKGSLSPQWAAHNFAHACAVTGTQPHVPWTDSKNKINSNSVLMGSTLKHTNSQPLLFGIYEPVRELTTHQITQLLHTTLSIPYFSNDITPYVSDAVCMPTGEQIQSMVISGGQGTWPESAFELTECIDNAMSAPNDYFSRANDCEGGTAMHNMTYRNICGLFATARNLLQDLSEPKDRDALANWVCNDCNTVLPTSQHYAFAVQAMLLGLVAQYAADCETLTVGAKSASFSNSAEQKQNAEEGGHSCAALKVNEKHIDELRNKTYGIYRREHCKVQNVKFNFLSRQIATELKITNPDKSMFSSNVSTTHDLAEYAQYKMVESTAPIEMDYETGVVSATIIKNHQAEEVQVPFATYFSQMELSLVKDNFTDMANVRVQGFNTKDADSEIQPSFYSSVYMVGNKVPAQRRNGRMHIGTSANDFLYHNKSAEITMEKYPMPLLGSEEIKQYNIDMEKQWEETRLPTVGSSCIQKMISNWYAAPATPLHYPANHEKQIVRCTVTLSGQDGNVFIKNHQKEIACGKSLMIPTQNGLIVDSHVYPAFRNSVFVANAVDMPILRQRAQNL